MPSTLSFRLVIAFGLVIASFCGSTLYSNTISRSIDAGALSIANDAMPSIAQLSVVRGEVRRLRAALSNYAVTRDEHERKEVLAALADANQAFEHYLALPKPYAAEQALWGELHRVQAGVNRAVSQAANDLVTEPPQALMALVEPALNQAADVLRAATDLHASQGRMLALRIEKGRRRATRVSLLLDLLSTLFTAAAALLTLRALAQHHAVVEERNRLVARRAEELEQFAGRVAHDILGPLSATRLAVGHATTQIPDGNLRRLLDRGVRGIERVTTIVDGLLRFARAGAQPEPGVVTTLAPILEALVAEMEPAAAQRSVRLELLPVPVCSVYGNAGVISSVVENLVRNAVKYAGDGEGKHVIIRAGAGETLVRFEVEDNGPGIPLTLLPTLFDPHVRGTDRREPGIGLGLATVKRIVESHHGRVGVESRPGEGCRFWCELPRADTVDEPGDRGHAADPGHSHLG